VFKLVFMSRRYDVSFRDVCHILVGDDVFWESLLMFVLFLFGVCVCVLRLYGCFLYTVECCSCFAVPFERKIKPMLVQ
jgi:hypothetical protein